ncbi:FkbM family methyltransferase [Mariprofundus sp. EBB-1]|uniref:FkbM family methyltransferase n=1 Tax=Mariprofundus sp. EBB-1 TaxID=2650971 RepID=UPI000EF21DAF|nr:FkbM family methyltransferase [Mariprofundus sp. EBB-1]RLL51945.1 FkbM family methyltransferase [Mariprofundus sp. EBB-1]
MLQMIRNLKRFYDVRIRKDSKRMACYNYYDQHGEMLRLDYPLNKNAIVIDAGGYVGDFASSIFCKFGCHVDVFEPIAVYAEKIKERFKYNDCIEVLKAGLAAADREENIHVTGLGSSVFDAPDNIRKDDIEKIKLVSVVGYLQAKSYEKVDLLKINIEGGEYELLIALLDRPELIEHIEYLQIQFHDFVPDAVSKRENIRQRLSETHQLMWDFPFIWESWERKREQ